MPTPRIRYKSFDQISIADALVYSKLPLHPFWSNLEKKVDFSFADSLCAVLYSGRGQPPYAPSLKLKVHLIETYYALSDRRAEEKVIGDLFIKRFLQVPVDFFGFDHSTIALDRSRMGVALFQACHLYILAQMYSHGLWGEDGEQWIIDSFPSHASLAMVSCCQLVRKSIESILQHVKRTDARMYASLQKNVSLDAMDLRVSASSSTSEKLLAFSKLFAQAHGFLLWFETEEAQQLYSHWEDPQSLHQSLELRNRLKQILEENTKPFRPDDGDQPPGGQGEEPASPETEPSAPPIEYEKIPAKERPSNRIVSTFDPEARVGKKRSKSFLGYKIQNLCTSSGVILGTRVIPATEHDQEAMVSLVKEAMDALHQIPSAVLGDSHYGHGKQRKALAEMHVDVVAPVVKPRNPTGLFDLSKFTYDRETNTYRCPNGKQTVRKARNNPNAGYQHFFAEGDCQSCPLLATCTTGKCRSVFHSDYYDIYEEAAAFNKTEEGKELQARRYLVERKNKELKLDCGLGAPRTHGREALEIKAKLASMVVNLKLRVRKFFPSTSGFLRRPPKMA